MDAIVSPVLQARRGTFQSTSGLSFAQIVLDYPLEKELHKLCTNHQPERSEGVKYFSLGTKCKMYLRPAFLLIRSGICKPPAEACSNAVSGIICAN